MIVIETKQRLCGMCPYSILLFIYVYCTSSLYMSLLNGDYFKLIPFRFQLRVAAADTAYPFETATATVDITVSRNEGAPVFMNIPYEVTIPESTSVGTCFLNLTAIDSDGVSVLLICMRMSSYSYIHRQLTYYKLLFGADI